MKKATLLLALSYAMAAPAAMAADAFPAKPVTAIVPMAAGGPTDLLMRAVQQKMSEALGKNVLVQNKDGASGLIGLRYVLAAPADGYTLAVANATSHGILINLTENLPYDPQKDFKAVGGIVVAPGVLISSKTITPDCKFDTLVKKIKAEPGKYKFGSAGSGALSHITGEAFLHEIGGKMLHVPYRGLAPAMVDLYAGSTEVVFDIIGSARSHIESGKVCALAIQSDKRLPGFENIPTYSELGYPQLNRPAWYGLVARHDTPDDVVLKLNHALNKALESDDVKRNFVSMGTLPIPGTPQDFARRIDDEIRYWRDMLQKIGLPKKKI